MERWMVSTLAAGILVFSALQAHAHCCGIGLYENGSPDLGRAAAATYTGLRPAGVATCCNGSRTSSREYPLAVPAAIKSDNGSEFVAKKVQDWIEERGIGALFIDPGSPWQNGHNVSFNGVFRDGCLDRWLFESVREAREVAESWLGEYNEERPHGSLNGMTPAAFSSIWKEDEREAA